MDQLLPKFPRVSVKAVFRCGNKVLYYKTKKGINDVPGGHIEFGEGILDALRRELKEEIGFSLSDDPILFHAWHYISRDGSNHRVYLMYLIDLPEKISFKSLEYPDGINYVWANKEEILDLNIMEQQKEFLIKAIKYKK
jgi:8-oxo-dGTP diphosphatase